MISADTARAISAEVCSMILDKKVLGQVSFIPSGPMKQRQRQSAKPESLSSHLKLGISEYFESKLHKSTKTTVDRSLWHRRVLQTQAVFLAALDFAAQMW